ncbi:MAG: leucine-rich repeat protein [Clostridiales bacterium]|nr:leucine-rich repeat protein [Clostridiales bacterium]
MKSIELPKQVTTIGANAFMRCSRIKTLEIPGNVQTIGKTAFAICTGLEELESEEGVQTVEEAAFAECSSLNAMILPKSVSNFATNFVTDYNPVKRICYRGTREQWIAANLSSDNFYNAKEYIM